MNKELAKILEQIAKAHNTTIFEVKKEMELAIEEAWKNKTDEFIKTFGDRKPTVEEFIIKIVGKIM